ncbi:cryptochrome/photolyase family protein [Candidatus Acidianus copahuensis]|nr:deoxyribodipyrimidine photo-lyase [Candidatus Acidianus copahuensis]
MKCVFWFRRDLRIHDNTALSEASERCEKVFPVLVIDPNIMFREDTSPRRAQFYLEAIKSLRKEIPLTILYGNPVNLIHEFYKNINSDYLFFNRDYGFYASRRDSEICRTVKCLHFKDHVLVERGELPVYRIFTPYYIKWKNVEKERVKPRASGNFIGEGNEPPELFKGFKIPPASEDYALQKLEEFKDDEYPERRSGLSHFFKIGLLSTRTAFHAKVNEEFRRQLCWRDFYYQLYTSDFSLINGIRRKEIWENKEEIFKAWTEGKTGYPIVDAGMRELNVTGLMENKLRLLTSYFLTKVLLIDWRKGMEYFMKNLLDGDFVINLGNWQWIAGVGTDMRPLRKFNIVEQGKRIDPRGEYIKKWVEELRDVEGPLVHEPWKLGKERVIKIGYVTPIADLGSYDEFVRRYKGYMET